MPCTAPEVRAFIPTNTEIQQKHSAKAMADADRRPSAETAVGLDPEAHDHAERRG